MSKYVINGYVHIRCENCHQGNWLKEDIYNNKKYEYNQIFCEKLCEVSFKFRQGCYTKLKKKNNNSHEEEILKMKNIKIIGTISASSSSSSSSSSLEDI